MLDRRPIYREIGIPCCRTWTPRTCRSTATDPAARMRSPIDHMCLTPVAIPHVCVCGRCGSR